MSARTTPWAATSRSSSPDLDDRSNRIGWNGASGIGVNSIVKRTGLRGNVFHDNAVIAIDLDLDGVTPNDADDVDTGANKLQNTPELDTGPDRLERGYRPDRRPLPRGLPRDAGCLPDRRRLHGDGRDGARQVWVGATPSPSQRPSSGATSPSRPPAEWAIIGEYLSAMATDSNSSGNSSEVSPTHRLPEPGVVSALGAGIALLGWLRRPRSRSH